MTPLPRYYTISRRHYYNARVGKKNYRYIRRKSVNKLTNQKTKITADYDEIISSH